jgi:NaMN:DMB phosphoribosyltransferase
MDEDRLNMSVRKFLKEVGVTSQRVIEKTVRHVLEARTLSAGEGLDATMTLEIPAIGVKHVVTGRIETG